MAQTQPRSPPPSWSDIPLDLAGQVLRLLPSYADRARFSAVCPPWRNAAQQFLRRVHPPLPLLALPDGTFHSLPYTKPFRFPGFGFAGYQGVCGSWLVFPRDDGCFLHDPFARATVRLPALSDVRLRPPNAVAKWTKWVDGGRSADPYSTWMHIYDTGKLQLYKLIMCSPNLVAALVGFGTISQILMCQPGASSWSVRAYDKCRKFEDMAFYQGKLYAVAKDDENLLVVNISQHQSTGDPQVSRIGRVINGDPCCPGAVDNHMLTKKLYLVESRGKLLMIRRKIWALFVAGPGPAQQNEFDVFEADFEHLQWVDVTTVGDDQVLFLGRMCSRSVNVSQYGLSGDRIFFFDDEDKPVEDVGHEDNTSCSAYDMINQVSSPYPMISWKHCDEVRLAAWLFPED